MSNLVNIGTIGTGFLLIYSVIKLIVKRKMTESQSVLWLIIGLVTILIGAFPSIIEFVANLLGIWYPPTIVFLIAYVGLLFIVFKNTVVISIQSNQINELFMQIALLNLENEKLKEALDLSEEVGSH